MRDRVGIIGGTFDPIHIGHLIIAQDALEQFGLDRVLFAPAWQAPLKAKPPVASPEHRMGMARAAVAGNDRFEVSDVDFEEQTISYSVRTAERLARRHTSCAWVWILGTDQLAQLGRWRDIDALAAQVEFAAFEREGFDAPQATLPAGVTVHMAAPRKLDISSTEIRDRLQAGLAVNYFLPPPVLAYIKAKNLYCPTTIYD